MQFIYYPKCSTCIKAKKKLESLNIHFESRDIILNTPSKEELISFYKKSNLPLKKFFNTSGILYKEMNLKEKIPFMNEDEMLTLLSANGKLIKRPILVSDDFVVVGYKEDTYENLL